MRPMEVAVAAPEFAPAPIPMIDGVDLHRFAGGLALEVLCNDLELIIADFPHASVRVPIRPGSYVEAKSNVWNTKLELVKPKEVRKNRALRGLVMADIEEDLHSCVPTLQASRRVTATTLDVHHDKQRNCYLSLLFSKEDGDVLRQERCKIWEVLSDIAEERLTTLDWQAYVPDIRLAFVPGKKPGSEDLETDLVRRINRQLLHDIDIRLGPALGPVLT